ncbi:LysM peptidoglycan-binding domain-containing protein [Weissella confusa]|uniref:CAP domain-containing protein n=1 Tax=Weissella confusa TaxID=1583 RepID=UPI0002465729|nr:CAP domain-containing protein [Weissella confusa]MBJ7616489.1 KxYKxGKxW signal peptide domain-containing protein [Weissella confusa]MBJ7626413.1 KxYKxGKxW signal peptide domain-containing protein [Weissella confusa]MCT8392478.1 LysM peptidoglycan-binding domain-containing protein [Weissella confusa]CCF31456.1 LysM repeat-containing protein [Weissella confusa LBAE C39-2]
MELKKHYKMYKSGKQLVVAAVATVAAGVMFAGNQSASADSWQAKSVDQVSAELQQAGNVSNYTIQNGDTVWALATALNMSVEDFSAQYGIANPELIIAGQSVNGQIVVVPVSSEATVVSDADAAASQADEQSAAAASQAAASQAAADSAYAASVAAAQQAQADSAAAASVAAAQQAQATVSSDAAQSAAPAATDQQASVDTPAQTAPSAPVATGSYADAVNQMNILRRAAGLAPVTFDEGLAAKAQARAEQLAGSVDESHWSQSYGPEVIAIGFGAGAGAINAWYHETNMDGAPGHYNWLMKATTTRVGFGYDAATGTFVGESN